MNPAIDNYLAEGCGRCSLGGTPQCKVHFWPIPLKALRAIVLSCGLVEELKWGVPCYTFQGKNVVIVAAFKHYCSLSFFKGALLQDEEGLLEKPGENSQESRQFKFTDIQRINAIEPSIRAYIFEAIELEKAGVKFVSSAKKPLELPQEFIDRMDQFPALKAAFESLTPGRQRAYALYFSQPKQAKTREGRIDRYFEKILQGKGFMD